MKANHWLRIGIAGTVLSLGSAQAAIDLGLQAPTTWNGYGADFRETSLNFIYNSTTHLLTASNSVAANFTYKDSTLSPGTGNQYNNSGAGTAFQGYFLLSANIGFDSSTGTYDVTGGTVSIDGNLLGGTQTSTLMVANLVTGPRNLGYGNAGANVFEFLFSPTASSNSKIFADFLGSSGVGGIILTAQGLTTFDGSFDKNYVTSFGGFADVFVPEPGAYSTAAALSALFVLVLACRNFNTNQIQRKAG